MKRKDISRFLILTALVACPAWLAAGCAFTPPDRAYVEAGDRFVGVVGPEYLLYVEADTQLDEMAKQARRDSVRAFRLSTDRQLVATGGPIGIEQTGTGPVGVGGQ